jgi:hypothetical protein
MFDAAHDADEHDKDAWLSPSAQACRPLFEARNMPATRGS